RGLGGPGTKAMADAHPEPLPAGEAARKRLVLEAVTERREHDQGPHPRRLNPTPGAVGLLPLAHPVLGDGDCTPAALREARHSVPRRLTATDLAQVDRTRPDGL